MKKNYFKKSLSLVLTVLMLMSCWVFFPAENSIASAAEYTSLTDIQNANVNQITTVLSSDTTTITANKKGSFTNDSSGYDTSAYYNNLLYAPAYTNGATTGVASTEQVFGTNTWGNGPKMFLYWHYAGNTVMMYDGVTQPSTGVMMISHHTRTSGTTNFESRVYSSWLTNSDLKLSKTYWKGVTSGNLDFAWAISGGDGDMAGTSSSDKTKYYSRKHDNKAGIANYMSYTGSMSDTEWKKTLTPEFKALVYGAEKKDEKTATASGTAGIFVINVKPLKAAYTAAETIKTNITNDYDGYSPASVEEFVTLYNKLKAANPNKYDWSKGLTTVNKYAEEASAAVTAWNEWVAEGGLKKIVKVTWDIEGTKSVVYVGEGDTPSYSGTPTKASTVSEVFTHEGWTPAITAVTKDTTFKATFKSEPRKYIINFYGQNDSLIQSVELAYGSELNVPAAPAVDGYRFKEWSPAVNTTVTGAVNYYAQYSKLHKVTFENWDGTDLYKDIIVVDGDTATYPGTSDPRRNSDADYGYTFTGWSPALGPVTEDTVYTAQYSSKGHSLEPNLRVAATCTTAAQYAMICSECKYNAGIVTLGNPLGHSYEREEPTWFVGGMIDDEKHEIYCVDCYEPSEGTHSWILDTTREITTSTCKKQGESYYLCECGADKTEYEALNPNNHENVVSSNNAVAPQCGIPGKESDTYCKSCKNTVTVGAVIPALEHDFTGAIQNNGDGTHSYLCKNGCNTYGGTVACSNWVEDGDNCKCADCGYTKEHAFGGWSQDAANTDTAPGKMSKTCGDCGKVVTVDCTNYIVIDRTAEDCDNAEVITYKCSDCGHVYSAEGKPATGHDYTGTIQNNGDGTHSYLCNNGCNTYGGTVNCSNWVEDGDNCKCGDCGYTKAHNWGDGWKSDSNQMTAEGSMTRVCLDCGKTENEACRYEVVAGSHKDATCTTPEMTSYKCSDCGHGYTKIGEPAKGHKYEGALKYAGKVSDKDAHYYLCLNGCGTYGFNGVENSVELCTITHTNNGDGTHNTICEKNCGNESNNVACSGGEAKCNALAVCSSCNGTYGDFAPHNYSGTAVALGDGKHAYRCKFCNGQDKYGVGADEGATEACSGGTATCNDLADCSVCDQEYGNYAAHVYNGAAVKLPGDVHAYKCSVCDRDEYYGVGNEDNATVPCYGGDADCRNLAVCEECKDTHGSYGAHRFDNSVGVKLEGDVHAYECRVCKAEGVYGIGRELNATEACSGGTATCDKLAECTICHDGHGAYKPHTFNGTAVKLDGDVHAYRCSVCKNENLYGVGTTENATEACSGGTAYCNQLAVCEECKDTHGGYADHRITGKDKYISKFKATDATCIDNETYYVYCIDCEDVHSDETYEKPNSMAPHVYTCADEYLYIAAQAKCGVNEKYYYYCSYGPCHKSSAGTAEESTYEKPDTALEHNWVNPVSNGDGTHTYSCSQTNTDGWSCLEKYTLNCADSKALIITKAPTCTANGYTKYSCTICKYEWTTGIKEALGHDYSQEIRDTAHTVIAATCGNGSTYWYDCARCDKNAKDETDTVKYTNLQYDVNDKLDHKFVNNIVDEYRISEATCTAAAKYYASCEYCGKSSEELNGAGKGIIFSTGKSLGHDWVKPAEADYKLATDASCVANATYYYTCSRSAVCGCTTSKGVTDLTWELENSKSAHDFNHEAGYKAKVEPTCTTAGNEEYWYCKVCEIYYKDDDGKEAFKNQAATVIKALGHDIVNVAYKKATCTDDGNPAYKYCKHCDYTTKPSDKELEAYKATGHNFTGAWTCDETNDYHSKLCFNGCGAKGLVVDGKQDEYDAETKAGGEACTYGTKVTHYVENGINYHATTCVCGNKDSTECYDADPVVYAPTCKADGYTANKCDVCKFTWNSDIVSKSEHVADISIIANNDGSHTYRCVCGDERIESCYGGTAATCKEYAKCEKCGADYGKKPSHSFAENGWTSNNDATCTVDGTKSQKCANCDYVETLTDKGSASGHKMVENVSEVPAKLTAILAAAGIEIKAPTCKEEGFTLNYCENCTYYTTRTVPKLTGIEAHDFGEYKIVGGNCATGVTEEATCKICGAKTSKVSSMPHSWKAIEIKEADCENNGFILYSCDVCKATRNLSGEVINKLPENDYKFEDVTVSLKEYEAILAVGHEFEKDSNGNDVIVETKKASCSQDGRGYKVCLVCEHKVDIVLTDRPAHRTTYNAGKAATCTTYGWEAYESCVTCGKDLEEIVYIAALGHEDSNKDSTCDRCGAKFGNAPVVVDDGCICHKENGFMKFMYSFMSFFWKLFKINKTCACGATHY